MSIAPQPLLTRDEEWELTTGLLEGDREAFELFYRLFAGSLTSFARNWLSTEDADAIVDDVMLEAAAAIEEYEQARSDGTNLGTWLLVRCRARVIASSSRAQRTGGARTVPRGFWARLSAPEKEVVALVHFYGLAYEETAERLGIDPSTVQEHAQRARAALGQIS